MLAPVRVTAPAVPVVTFGDGDSWLRLDGDTSQRALVDGLIEAATARLDGWAGILGRCLINQVWRVAACAWPADGILRLPFPDVSAATVTYLDTAGDELTVAGSAYGIHHDARGAFLRLDSTFDAPALASDSIDAIRVAFTAGYGATASDVPAPIRTAILLMVSHWFHHREAVADDTLAPLPVGVDALIAPYRRTGV